MIDTNPPQAVAEARVNLWLRNAEKTTARRAHLRLLLTFAAIYLAVFGAIVFLSGCTEDPGLHYASFADAGTDSGMSVTATIADSGQPDVYSADAVPYMPPPMLPQPDGGTKCRTLQSGVNVPCIRWAPAGQSCWFPSDISGGLWDGLCEDSLPGGGWCQCLGDDWGQEQNLNLGPDTFPCCAL